MGTQYLSTATDNKQDTNYIAIIFVDTFYMSR